MSEPLYYYSRDRQTREGPLPFAELQELARRGVLRKEHLIWTDGMGEWSAAGIVPGVFADGPPPIPVVAPTVSGPVARESVWEQPQYAGFWLRLVAWIIDTMVLAAGGLVVGVIVGIGLGILLVATGSSPSSQGPTIFDIVGWFIGIVLGWLYFALMESSANQATLGKMALGLRVTTDSGGRLTFGRASGRYFAKLISGFTFLIGYIMAGFTERKQALHDLVAGCLVIRVR